MIPYLMFIKQNPLVLEKKMNKNTSKLAILFYKKKINTGLITNPFLMPIKQNSCFREKTVFCFSGQNQKNIDSESLKLKKLILESKITNVSDLNFLKKSNRFQFLLKNNVTNKWVNWINNPNSKTFEIKKKNSNKILKQIPNQNQIKANPSNFVYTKNLINNKEFKLKNIYKSGYSKIHELKLVSIEIASAEKMKRWAEKILPNGKIFGEVTNANTLHYKTFRPHKGGLFCERIFGPLKDFECACGIRSKPIEFESYINENEQRERFFCMNCDVEYTWSVIRRYQLGYIKLISPVSHIWFLKANPSYLSLLLDLRRSHLESIVYCTEPITLENLWKSSQTLGLDTSPSVLYSIWQKLLEEEKLIKKQNKKILKNKNYTIIQTEDQKRSHFKNIYKNEKDIFNTPSNFLDNYLKNQRKEKKPISFLKRKILLKNQSSLFEKFYFQTLKSFSKETFFQILFLSKKTFFFSLNILFLENFQNKIERKNLKKNLKIRSNLYEKEILKFKEDFLSLAQSFFKIYFSTFYIKNIKNKKFNNLIQLLCEFFIFYFLEIQLSLYNKMNLNNNFLNEKLDMIRTQNFKNTLPIYKTNKYLHLKKIQKKNNQMLKIYSKIKKGINNIDSFLYYSGICLEKKQVKLNAFFQEEKTLFYFSKIIKKNKISNQTLENISSNNVFGNLLNSIGIYKIDHRFQLNNIQSKNLLKSSIDFDFFFQKKNRKNLLNCLYLFYAFLKKEAISINKFSEFESKQDENNIKLKKIYFSSFVFTMFYIKNQKLKFSEITEFNNIINSVLKISKKNQSKLKNQFKNLTQQNFQFHLNDDSLKMNKLEKSISFAPRGSEKSSIRSFATSLRERESEEKISFFNNKLTQKKSFSKFNKKKSLHLRKKLVFLQKQKSSQNFLFKENFFNNQINKKLEYNDDLEFSFQTKILKNDLYTISYNHLWPLNAAWKSFFYYNSAPKDFEDIPLYYLSSQILDSRRKGNFYTQSKNSTFGDFNSSYTSHSMMDSISIEKTDFLNNEDSKFKEKSEFNIRTTEFLSKIQSPLAGASIVKKLLSEYTPYELKKMVKQHQVLLPKLNNNIRQLKEKAIKKIDFVKIQKLLTKRDHIIRRLKLLRKFSRKNVDPTSMILSVLPVLPPDLRPILKLQNQIAASDLNRLYQRIIYRNERLKKFLKDPSTSQSFEMKYAQRLLQEAVDNLIQNGKGNVKPETNSRGQALKSLSEILKGKQGRFRQYLLGKRVDYSGRSVIVVGPKLKLYECGLPKEMAIELFLPFLMKRILHYKMARTVIGAKNFLFSNKTYCINLLNEIMRNHPILLNRAPTLHRLGIQAFQPKLVEGRAILLHPLVCPAFNADFDGDQMAVHLPITVEARAEAWTLLFSRNHLISAATGDPIVLPSQDMVLGCYYLTSEKKILSKQRNNSLTSLKKNEYPFPSKMDGNSSTKDFFCISNLFNFEKVLNAYQLGKISVQSIVWIKWTGKIQFANEPLTMREMRLNCYGIRDKIQSKSYKRINKEEVLLTQYIRTTPGRILINSIAQKCMFL
uniref:DNA-directed RNA polymerase subunit beta' n=1 Tax=Stauridium tetras TaxID=271398 RepID=A0A2U8GJT9_9CHLO|nr:beta subunit of RNA polymerase [Stauridium tetras]AWI68952.1 beta subunit of RNA polymerase [Stauridium tetras]